MSYHKLLLFVSILLALILLANNTIQPAVATPITDEYVFRRSWGGEGNRLRAPADVALSPDRTMYIADYGFHRIIAIRPDRTYFTWGTGGTGNGELRSPYGIAVDQNGNVFVADTYNNRIQKFSSTGEYITQWGSLGSGNGQFDLPYSVAVDGNGYVYVIDTFNFRIQKFTNNGTYVTQWNGANSPGGTLGPVLGIATDSNNNVYVVAHSDGRVIKFNSNGDFLAEWYIVGSGNGANNWAYDLAVDKDGNVYVPVWRQHEIQKFDANGVHLLTWGGGGTGPGYFQYPEGITAAVDSGGSVAIYIADTRNARVQLFDSNGNYRSKWGEATENGQFRNPERINLDQNGNIYVSDAHNNRVQKFNNSGSFLAEFDNHFYSRPSGVAVDSFGNIYVVRKVGSSVQKYNSALVWLSQWGTFGSGDGQFDNPSGIAVDNNGNVYVADFRNNRIQKFTNNGAYLTQWGSQGNGNGQNFFPGDIAIDSSNNVYVTDASNYRVQKFTSTGTYLTQWGSQGTGNGEFDSPNGIATDSFGNVYVTEGLNDRVQKFNTAGAYITQWGGAGNTPGKFYYPADVDVDNIGNVYVLDSGNSRVQQFSSFYPALDPVSGLILNGSFEQTTPNLNEWTYGGSLPANRINQGIHGQYALQLVQPVPSQDQGEGQAWIHQAFYIDPNWDRPVLSFQYKMFVNDTIDYSDFFVEIQDGVGLNTLATVLRDGFQPCVPNQAPYPGTALGWRSTSYDLSAFKGQHVRLVFSNRNLWPISWGIWTYVDDVRVVDAGPLPPPSGTERAYLPIISSQRCDIAFGGSNLGGGFSNLLRPAILP